MNLLKHTAAFKMEQFMRSVEAEITSLRAENERLREALTPFAEEVKNWDAYAASNDLWDGIVEGYKVTITMSDCRRAAAALKENS